MSMTIAGARELARRFDSIASSGTRREVLSVVGLTAVAEAKRLEAPHRKTGNLGRTIRIGKLDDRSVQVLAGGSQTVGYAADLEFGTRPHVITAKRGKALRFSKGGVVMFRRSVNHPGSRPYPYLVPGAIHALRLIGLTAPIVSAWNRAA